MVKVTRSNILVRTERSHHKKCTYEIRALYLSLFKSYGKCENFQICRSEVTVKVTRSKFWYERKGLSTRNVHMQYESPTLNGSKVTAYVKFSDMWVKGHGQGLMVKNFGMNGKAPS